MEECDEGDWVKYEDYKILEEELKKKSKIIQQLYAQISQIK